MRPPAIRFSGYFALALLPIAPQAVAVEAGTPAAVARDAMAQAASPQAIAEYHRKLAQYQEARAVFEEQASAYWNSIADKRRGRNARRREHLAIGLDDYVRTQPPVYTGPKRPGNPEPSAPEPEQPRRERKYIPVVADLVKGAAEYFQRTQQPPSNELEFKRAYASFASVAGLTREQAVRIYAFETGGNGNHASQSGFHGSHANSTAIGYNQLLTTNTVELLAEQGPALVKVLTEKAARLSGPARQVMDRKI